MGTGKDSFAAHELAELREKIAKISQQADELHREQAKSAEKAREFEVVVRSLGPELTNSLGAEIRASVARETGAKIRLIVATLAVAFSVIAAAVGFDFWKTQLLRTIHQKMFPVNLDPQMADTIWHEMEDKVATSYAESFSLGSVNGQTRDFPKYKILPFFAPDDMDSVDVCYTIKYSGTGKLRGVEIQLDEHAKKKLVPPPANGDEVRTQHDCLDNFRVDFDLKQAEALGTNEHQLIFSLAAKDPDSSRVDITTVINVLGKIPARKRRIQ
jgi:hypothetical protein